MAITGLQGIRAQEVLNAVLQSNSVDPKLELSSTQITSTSQIDSILRAHILHLQGKATEPKINLEDLLDAASSINLSRKNLEMLVDLASLSKDTATQKKLIDKVKETYDADPSLIPTITNIETVNSLMDYLISGLAEDDRKSKFVLEFAESIKNDRLDEFARLIQGDSVLTKVLILSKKQGLTEDLKSLEKKFLSRLTNGNADEFSGYPELREFLADKVFKSRKAFSTPGQVMISSTARFNTVQASAQEMTDITQSKINQTTSFSFSKILKSLVEAKDENAILDSISDCHKMLTVLEYRYVNGNPNEQRTAAQQLETFYALIQNRSVMGDLQEVFRDVIVKHQEVLADIPNVFTAAVDINEDHLYNAVKDRLLQIGYSSIPNNSAQFTSLINDKERQLSQTSDELGEELFSKIFSQKITSEEEVNRGVVARQVLTCVNDETHSVDLKEKFDFLKEVFIDNLLDKIDYKENNKIDLTNNTRTVLEMYYPGITHIIPHSITTRDDLKAAFSTPNIFDILIDRAKEDSLSFAYARPAEVNLQEIKEQAQTLYQINTLIQNPNEIVAYVSDLIRSGIFSPKSVTNFKSIVSELVENGTITTTKQASIEEAFNTYPSDLNRTATAFTSMAQAYLSQAGKTASDIYVRIYEALNIKDKANDSTFIIGANHGLDKVAEAMHNIFAEIEQGNVQTTAEKYLYKLLYEDEIDAKSTPTIHKHIAQGELGELGLLISDRKLGTEATTKKTPEILGLAKIIYKANEDVQNGKITQQEYIDLLKQLEDRIGIKFRFYHSIATNITYINNSPFKNIYQNYVIDTKDFARFSLEAAKLSRAVDNGATAVPARRLYKMVGREYFQSEQVQDMIEKTQSFLESLNTEDSNQSTTEWLESNKGSDSGIVRLALKMTDQERFDDYGTVRYLSDRSFDSDYSSRLKSIIENLVRYYILNTKKPESQKVETSEEVKK